MAAPSPQVMLTSAATAMARSMPLGGLSPLTAVNASRYADPKPPAAPEDEYLELSCVLYALSGLMDDGTSLYESPNGGYRESYITQLAGTARIHSSKLSPAVPRLTGYIMVSDLRSISEVASSVSSFQDATNTLVTALSNSVVPKSLAVTIGTKVALTILADYSKSTPTPSDEELLEAKDVLAQNFDTSLQSCPLQAVTDQLSSTQVVDTEQAASGGLGAQLPEQSDISVINNTPVQMPWGQFRAKPAGSGPIIELVDKYGVARALTKSSGETILGMQLNMSPESLTINSVKVVNRYQTIASWVEEHWGDELDQVSFSGKSLGLVVQSDGVKYLAVDTRVGSPAYQELRSVVNMYQANGLVLQGASVTDPTRANREFYTPNSREPVRRILSHPRTGMVQERLYVRITFDFVQCIGYFESFELVEDADSPYLMSYSVNFRSEMTTYQ